MISEPTELIQSLIRIDSISGNEHPLAQFFFDWLKGKFTGAEVTLTDRNCTVTITGRNFSPATGKTLLLCSHYDTVPACSGWTKDPFGAEIIDGRIYGLGANDALASVVSMTFGALEARQAIVEGYNRVVLSFVCEEEKGSAGFVKAEPVLPRYTWAVFGEPTSLRIGYCMRGSLKLKVFARGKSCHASRPHEGDNPIFKLGELLEKIKSIPLTDDSPWGTATLEPVIIRGGKTENQVPDVVEIFLDSRPTWERNNEYIIDAVRNIGLDFEVIKNLRRPMAIEKNHDLVRLLQEASPSSELYPFGGSCDMAFTTAPSIVFGPGASERSHAADEFITVHELQTGCDVFGRICKRFAERPI